MLVIGANKATLICAIGYNMPQHALVGYESSWVGIEIARQFCKWELGIKPFFAEILLTKNMDP